MREEMKIEIKRLNKEFGMKIVLVKNEKGEEIKMEERVEIMKGGKIKKIEGEREI